MAGWRSNLRRACTNPNRASFEMLVAWRAGGTSRAELLQKWMSSQDVATVTAELVLREIQQKLGPHCRIY